MSTIDFVISCATEGSNMPTIKVEITEQEAALVHQQMESGAYLREDEVFQHGLDLLEEREARPSQAPIGE